MTKRLTILILIALGLGVLVRALRIYGDHQLQALDAAMLRAQVPFGPEIDPDPWYWMGAVTNNDGPHGSTKRDDGYAKFDFDGPGSDMWFKRAFKL